MKKCCFSCCLAIFVLIISHQQVGTVKGTLDRDRVILMYTNRTDRCRGISEGSTTEAKQAANTACEQAFLALDRLGLNVCTNWSRPECRAFPNQPHSICSVITSPCPLYVTDVIRQTRTFADCAPSLMTEEMLTGAPPRPSKQFSRNWQKTYRDALGVRRAKKDAQRAAAAAEQALADEQSLAAAMALVIEQAHAEEQARLLASTRYSPSRDSSGPGIASGPGSSSSRKGKEKVTGGSSARGGRATPTTPRARGVSIPGTQGDHGPSGGWGPYGTQGTPGRPVRQSRRGNLSNSRKAGKPYVCDTCGLTYSNHRTLTSHLKSHEKGLHCYVCDKNYNTVSSYKEHMRRYHEAEMEIRGAEIKPHECDVCHKRYSRTQALNEHKASHTDATTCPVCQKKYGKKSSLNEHIKKKHPSLDMAGDDDD